MYVCVKGSTFGARFEKGPKYSDLRGNYILRIIFSFSGRCLILTDSCYHRENQITDNSPAHNEYGKRRDLNAETRIAFTTHADADVGICFSNTLLEGTHLI